MKRSLTATIISLALLAGCTAPEKAPPAEVMPPQIPIESAANTRIAETQKAYAINRYVDPGDRRSMHERHVVYRVEEDAQWRLSSNAGQQILIGNTMGQGAMAYQPQPYAKEQVGLTANRREIQGEVASAVRKMEKTSTMLRENASSMSAELELLREEVQQLRNTSSQTSQVSQEDRERVIVAFEKAVANAETDQETVAELASDLEEQGILTPAEKIKIKNLGIETTESPAPASQQPIELGIIQ